MNALRWFHQIDFGDGVLSPGLGSIKMQKAVADIYFAAGVAGKSVLDIGCWDGFNALEAVRRGASRVLATDHWIWRHHAWATRETIELVREVLAPDMEILDADIPELTPERVGVFDVVLFCGVLYHLRNPLLSLESVARLAGERLIVETAMDASDIKRPAMIFYPTTELNGDGSNWWGPNRACVTAMLQDVGFRTVAFTPHPSLPSRGIFIGTR